MHHERTRPMAKTKADLLAEAKELKLEVTTKNTVAEITAAIEGAKSGNTKNSVTPEPKEEQKEEVTVAKAGKRSAKALAEEEAKEAKEARKSEQAQADAEVKPKQPVTKARPLIERRSKNYRKSHALIKEGATYSLKDALELATKTSTVKFDATVELHVRLGVDPRQADQNIRDTVILPAGTGKNVRVAVFADADGVAAAKKAGADIAASDEFLQQLDKGTINFDVLIVPPSMMPKLGKYARVLGPKGLMPNPKSGTVSNDIAKAVTEAKAGKVEYRVDSTGIVHLGVGKVSFGVDKLMDNAKAIAASIKGNKPASIKGSYVKSLFITTTMGPSIPVDANEL